MSREIGKRGERGATAVVVAIVIAMLFGFGALAVDVAHLYLSRSELQNAADACALRGAGMLYYDLATDEYTAIPQTTANEQGRDAGVANQSQKTAVEINWTAGNTGDVQRGHWNFDAHDGLPAQTFTPNDSTLPTDLWGVTTHELDGDTAFINAVRCVTRREATRVTNFLAPVLGVFGGNAATSIVRAEAVAYVGFAGQLEPGEVDQPIAVCAASIESIDPDTGETVSECNVGRMFNSNIDTSVWTNYEQSESNCRAAASSSVPINPDCDNGNPGTLFYGQTLDSTDGVQDNNFRDFKDCWLASGADGDADGFPDEPWEITLPVVDCSDPPCTPLTSAVTVEVVAIVRDGRVNLATADAYEETPHSMGEWECSISPADGNAAQHKQCWDELVAAFNLKKMPPDNLPAEYMAKSIYFKPSCDPQPPSGHTGGEAYGTLAKYPALVR